uniref:Uncharacterized protein n=1 Tax=Branchiostoma floridae TaxID=7739 RepID=C3ZVV3_BRAFL|eukprot:XP_002587303.1 hypothetical protein BRAFLDRAFT_100968 [Branchiostoma floridae]
MLVVTEANNSTPRLEPVRLCGRDFIRTVVRVCPDQGRRRRSLEEFEIPSKTSNKEGQTEENTKGRPSGVDRLRRPSGAFARDRNSPTFDTRSDGRSRVRT